jgi:uncharacterized damage-inducible protein DinB
MSTELERLELQIQRSFEGPAWHGPSVLQALQGLTAHGAHAHPVTGAHSVWELVLHLAGTYGLVLRRLAGEDAQLTPEQDWPPVPEPTESGWRDAIRSLEDLNGRVRSAVLRFDPGLLDEPLCANVAYTAYTQFIGITQHDLYHAGQIAILRKAMAGGQDDEVRRNVD